MPCFDRRVERFVSTGWRTERLRGHEPLKPATLGMQLRPVVEGEIDDDKAGCRQLFPQSLARLNISGSDQGNGEFVQTGIMADYQKRVHGRPGLLYDAEDGRR